MDEVDGCCTRRVLDCTRNVRCRRSVTIWRSQIVAGWPWERCQSRTLGILSQMLLYTLKEEQLWQRFSLAINIVCLFSPDSRLKQNLIDRKNWFVFRAHSGYSVRSDSGLFMALPGKASGGIMISTYPCSFVLWTRYFGNRQTEFDANCHSWSTWQGRETINFRGQVTGQCHTRLKTDLEAMRRRHSRPLARLGCLVFVIKNKSKDKLCRWTLLSFNSR